MGIGELARCPGAELAQIREEPVDLGIGPDRDTERVGQTREPAHQDSALLQGAGEPFERASLPVGEDEIRLRGYDAEPHRTEFALESRACRSHLRDVRPHRRLVLEGRERTRLREPIEVVGVLHLGELGGERGRGHREPDAQARERVRLREAAQDHEVPETLHEADGTSVGEVDVGLVGDHDRVGILAREPLDHRERRQGP